MLDYLCIKQYSITGFHSLEVAARPLARVTAHPRGRSPGGARADPRATVCLGCLRVRLCFVLFVHYLFSYFIE